MKEQLIVQANMRSLDMSRLVGNGKSIMVMVFEREKESEEYQGIKPA